MAYLAAIGTVISAVGSMRAGQAANAQYQARAMSERASSSRAAFNQTRDTEYLQSRARAYAAASGGSSDDPSVVNTIGQIGSEGEYRRLTALYEGDTAANASSYAGDVARSTGNMKGISTLLTGGASLASKYWPTPPPADTGYDDPSAAGTAQADSLDLSDTFKKYA